MIYVWRLPHAFRLKAVLAFPDFFWGRVIDRAWPNNRPWAGTSFVSQLSAILDTQLFLRHPPYVAVYPETTEIKYFQVDLLPEIALAPRILSNYVAALSHNGIKQDLDKFLQTRHQPVNFLAELPGKLRLSAHEVCVLCVSVFLSILATCCGRRLLCVARNALSCLVRWSVVRSVFPSLTLP